MVMLMLNWMYAKKLNCICFLHHGINIDVRIRPSLHRGLPAHVAHS